MKFTLPIGTSVSSDILASTKGLPKSLNPESDLGIRGSVSSGRRGRVWGGAKIRHLGRARCIPYFSKERAVVEITRGIMSMGAVIVMSSMIAPMNDWGRA